MSILKGIDVSMWQDGLNLANTGADFVICKATQGTSYVDPCCDNFYQQAKKLDLKRGVYHYASGGDPKAEADFFINNIRGYLNDAILVLDWESYQNPRFGEHASWCKVFLDRVYAKTGVRPLLYMSASVCNMANWSSIAKDYGLWVAGYPDTRDSWDIPDFIYDIPYWECIAIWQYTNSNGRLDRDVAYMSKDAWDLYAGKKQAVVEQPKKPVEAPQKPVEQPKEEKTQDKPTETEKPLDVVVEASNSQDIALDATEEKPAEIIRGISKEEYDKIIANSVKSIKLVNDTAKKFGFKIKMNSKLYDVLKLVAVVILPAISMIYLGLANIWGFGFGEQVDETIQLAILVINTILGLTIVKSSSDYKKDL